VYGARTAADGTYAFDNARAVQRERLRTLEALLDAGTIRHLEALGIEPDWRCLEVGAGGGSIALWLCDRAGSVVATDVDTTVLSGLSRPNLVVRAHDVLEDDLREDEFDLIHMRLVLAWLPDPQRALQRLVSALKPGGMLMAEEMDFVSVVPDPHMPAETARVFARVAAAHDAILAERHAFDPYYGRRVAGDLAGGLTDVGCEGRATMWRDLVADARSAARCDRRARPGVGRRGRRGAHAVRRPGVQLAVAARDGGVGPAPRWARANVNCGWVGERVRRRRRRSLASIGRYATRTRQWREMCAYRTESARDHPRGRPRRLPTQRQLTFAGALTHAAARRRRNASARTARCRPRTASSSSSDTPSNSSIRRRRRYSDWRSRCRARAACALRPPAAR
jgi:SAM-dependent methyltransferase